MKLERHLTYEDVAPEELGPAAVDDLLERGDLDDWGPVATAVRSDPHGRLAETILGVCAAHRMYGTSALWTSWIRRLRGEDREALRGLRRSRGLTQQVVAERMGISQSDVSKLERRRDVRLSTLRSYVEATGGALIVQATYPDTTYQVDLG